MHAPMFRVDFNEMVDDRTVLLSAADEKVDAAGTTVLLEEGMCVDLYMPDLDERGNPDDLVASGVVMRNDEKGWSAHVRWCCRIDDAGIRQRSSLAKK